jgi:hypothetical protein
MGSQAAEVRNASGPRERSARLLREVPWIDARAAVWLTLPGTVPVL